MRLTKEDEAILLEMEVPAEDIPQIRDVALGKYTRYYLYKNDEDRERRISADEAIRLLGRKEWLSGLSRSAFHYTAARPVENSEYVVRIDSRRYFIDW